jgi:putative membrane protein
LSLTYLSEAEGERLRQLVRQRRDVLAAPLSGEQVSAATQADDEEAETLFAMDPPRLFKFGLFEFSLAVFAVLAGVLQYLDSFYDFGIEDFEAAQRWLAEQGGVLASLGVYAQAAGAIFGIIGLLVVGSATGLIRTFTRDWGFLLERTARGFRRRRGLFTLTDVVMPIHRVQALKIGTGFLRYRFGWHGLRFVSLAQDAGAANHDVAPFAKMDEIAPIVAAAGFHLPAEDADWHRASKSYRNVEATIAGLVFTAIAIPLAIFAPAGVFLIPLGVALVAVAANLFAWRFQRHAVDATQVMSTRGVLAPKSQIATRLKLHSVEIAQGPISRALGYATLHLGLAGGTFAIPGVPIERAREVRRNVLDTIAATDFSRLDNG